MIFDIYTQIDSSVPFLPSMMTVVWPYEVEDRMDWDDDDDEEEEADVEHSEEEYLPPS